MKVTKLREMTVEQLLEESQALGKQLFRLRLQKATGQLDNVAKIGSIRRDLARVKTLITEKEAG